MISGSDLDRRITIERPQMVDAGNGYGPQSGGWAVVAARVPAQVKPLQPSKSEAVRQGLELASNQVRVWIRYMRSITSDMRITVHGESDEIFQIVGGPAEIGRRKWLEMVVEKYSS